MGKSKSLDTEDPPEEAVSLVAECSRRLEDNCNSCTESDKTRDLELNKVSTDKRQDCSDQFRQVQTSHLIAGNVRRVQSSGG